MTACAFIFLQLSNVARKRIIYKIIIIFNNSELTSSKFAISDDFSRTVNYNHENAAFLIVTVKLVTIGFGKK